MELSCDDEDFLLLYTQMLQLKMKSETTLLMARHLLSVAHKLRSHARTLLLLRSVIADKRRGRVGCFAKCGQWWQNVINNMSDGYFHENFRISKPTYLHIVQKLRSHLRKKDTNFQKAIPVEKRVAVALYTLSSSSEYSAIARLFGIGKATVHVLLMEFCQAVVAVLMPELIVFPTTDEAITANVNCFDTLWQFPQCIGAIDERHIEDSPPAEEAADHRNNRGWNSVVLMACVDAAYKYTYINVASTGRNNDDEQMLRHSALYDMLAAQDSKLRQHARIINGVRIPTLLLGDSAFPLLPTVMKPYPQHDNLSYEQQQFNYRLSRARKVTETAFCRLKARFRCLGNRTERKPEIAKLLVEAACALHNLCEQRHDHIDVKWMDTPSTTLPRQSSPIGNDDSGTLIRHTLAQSFV